jgi:hypothetical protein
MSMARISADIYSSVSIYYICNSVPLLCSSQIKFIVLGLVRQKKKKIESFA